MTTSNQFGFRVLLIVLLTFVSFEITLGQDANETALQTIVDETVDQNELVGLSVAVYNPTDGLTQAAAGVSVAGSDVDLSPQDMMYAGSVTKTFVSAAILQLVEEGELSLDDTLDMFFPDYPHADAITIRHMLGMTSGTFDYFRNAPDNPFIPVLMTDITYEWTPDEIIATAGSIAQPAVPGETYTYSNTDYILLGRIIEMTTGNDLHTELRQRLFTPLGMESVFMAGVENVPTEIAQGFVRDSAFLFGSEEPITTPRQAYVGLETLSWAAGGLVTHSGDLLLGCTDCCLATYYRRTRWR
jgi:D-alanyl-D-alanine carboxypeptidase